MWCWTGAGLIPLVSISRWLRRWDVPAGRSALHAVADLLELSSQAAVRGGRQGLRVLTQALQSRVDVLG
jgi:hypothetical protein